MRWKFLLLTCLCHVAVQASDGALSTFNALSMRDRGLLPASGESARPVLEPYFQVSRKRLELRKQSWEPLEYGIPQPHQSVDSLDLTLTYAAGYVAHAICQVACLHP